MRFPHASGFGSNPESEAFFQWMPAPHELSDKDTNMATWEMKIICLACLALTLAGCQSGEDSAARPQTVEERAQARWDRMVERDFAGAWEYYTPGFRQQYQQDIFASDMRDRPVQWLGAEVLESRCESDDKCEVTVSLNYRTQAPGLRSNMEVTRELKDEWIRLDGQWWYVKN